MRRYFPNNKKIRPACQRGGFLSFFQRLGLAYYAAGTEDELMFDDEEDAGGVDSVGYDFFSVKHLPHVSTVYKIFPVAMSVKVCGFPNACAAVAVTERRSTPVVVSLHVVQWRTSVVVSQSAPSRVHALGNVCVCVTGGAGVFDAGGGAGVFDAGGAELDGALDDETGVLDDDAGFLLLDEAALDDDDDAACDELLCEEELEALLPALDELDDDTADEEMPDDVPDSPLPGLSLPGTSCMMTTVTKAPASTTPLARMAMSATLPWRTLSNKRSMRFKKRFHCFCKKVPSQFSSGSTICSASISCKCV